MGDGDAPLEPPPHRWAVSLLGVQPSDRILEIGFGPGMAIRGAARHATNGYVVGIDHSAVMVRQATWRNRAAVREGRVDLRLAAVDSFPRFAPVFDKVLVVNSLGFWPRPLHRLIEIRSVMAEGGVIAVVSQPRCPGATREHTDQAEREIRTQLQDAGFADIRSNRFDLSPPVTCVLAARSADTGAVQDERHPSPVSVNQKMASEESARQSKQLWEAVAPAWERHRARIFDATKAISDPLVELVDAQPGNTILELAGGTGETGFLPSARLGPDGLLISSDFS
jgi:ubiquinone/menaquinone biosynthesis C-methylase UbiE